MSSAVRVVGRDQHLAGISGSRRSADRVVRGAANAALAGRPGISIPLTRCRDLCPPVLAARRALSGDEVVHDSSPPIPLRIVDCLPSSGDTDRDMWSIRPPLPIPVSLTRESTTTAQRASPRRSRKSSHRRGLLSPRLLMRLPTPGQLNRIGVDHQAVVRGRYARGDGPCFSNRAHHLEAHATTSPARWARIAARSFAAVRREHRARKRSSPRLPGA